MWASNSTSYNVEHIFFRLPAGNAPYEIWIRNLNGATVNYALAWWGVDAGPAANGTGSIGDRIWNDANANGVQEAGEAGMQGIAVRLYSASNVLIETTASDFSGNYRFNTVAAGSYYVQFAVASGFHSTAADAGSDDSLDSDIDATGQTGVFTFTTGEDLSVDAGFTPLAPGSISGSVWNDTNGDGLRQNGEPVAPGVNAELHNSQGDYVDSIQTDSSGNYHFGDVAPGNYSIHFAAPVNDAFTIQDAGSDDSSDSDVDASGDSIVFSLQPAADLSGISAGLVLANGALGHFVWYDSNRDGVQDANEAGAAYVAVKLYANNGLLVAGTTTDQSGFYAFSGVAPGEYRIQFVAPSGFELTTKDAGANDEIDSDADSSGLTGTLLVVAGGDIAHADAGLVVSTNPPAIEIPVVPVVNRPPAISPIANPFALEGESFEVFAFANDPDGDPVSYSLVNPPAGVTVDPLSGIIHFTGLAGPASFLVSVRATDPSGLYAETSFLVTVGNAASAALLAIDWPLGFQGSILLGSPVQVEFRNQLGPLQTGASAGFTYCWDFNEDGDFNDPGEAGQSNASTFWSFTTTGFHAVHGRVQDANGGFTDCWLEVFVES